MEVKKLLLMLCLCSSGVWAGDKLKELLDTATLEERDITCSVQLHYDLDHEEERVIDLHQNFLRVATAACQRFNCGSVVHVGLSPLPFQWLSCSESIRLVNGMNRCSGRLEVKTDQTWSSVCESDFDHQDAKVVCRELGCGAPTLLHGASYGGAESPTAKKKFWCTGDERYLMECHSSTSEKGICSSSKLTELTCSDSVDLRIEGRSHCSGQMMLKKQGILAPLTTDNFGWIVREGNTICEQLGCGSFIETKLKSEDIEENQIDYLWSVNTSCVFSTKDIGQCIDYQREVDKWLVIIKCSESIRLVDGMNRCSGRLEVKTDQTWSSVCQSHFDHEEAEVVCRELGCGAPSLLHGASYGGAESPTWKKEFLCTGDEHHLLDCDSSTPKEKICASSKLTELTCSDSVLLRLKGGSRCSGLIMVKKQGMSRTLTTDNLGWVVREGNTICEQLGCGSFIETTMALYDFDDVMEDFWSVNTSCVPSAFGIEECIKDHTEVDEKLVIIKCSESIRLVNGTKHCSGRLEVKTDQTWSSVCESDFDHQDAKVVCRELGCGAPSLLHGASYGGPDSPMWKTEFWCKGDERHLLECDSSTPKKEICSSSKLTELTCSDSDDLRLEERGQCSGRIVVKKQGILGFLMTDNLGWIVREGNTICEQLGCGSFIQTKMKALDFDEDLKGFLWSVNTSCIPYTNKIGECIKERPQGSNEWVFIKCSESIRLVNGMNRCSGRLEVKTDQTWSSVCQSDFDHQDAKVVCRELGCGAPSLLDGASYGGAQSPTWKKEFLCTGNEHYLRDCDISSTKKEICSSSKLTELTCSDSDYLRLEDGSRCSGQIMVNKQGILRPLTTDNLGWIAREGNTICQQLGCGSFIEAMMVSQPTDEDSMVYLWSVNTSCVPSTYDIGECIMDQLQGRNEWVIIRCSESIRLVNGMNRCSGRLEVKTDQTWSSVCQSDFNQEEAEVVCRELLCGVPSVFRGGLYGEAVSSAWTGEFWCEGSEDNLLHCGRSNENICSPDKAVGINCSVPQQMRLVGEESRCAGRLEINYLVDWAPVKYQWDDLTLGNKLCGELGCGSAVLMNKTKNLVGISCKFSLSCLESSSSLLNCLRLVYERDDVLRLVCTDFLAQPNITVSPFMTDVEPAYPQVFHVLAGSDFTITCSAQLQYQGGVFKLLFNNSDSVQIYILPAVNHSAHFNFSAAAHVHKGHYTCVYNVHLYSHNFSSESLTLGLLVSAPLSELMIRLVIHLLGLTALISTAIFYPKVHIHLLHSRNQEQSRSKNQERRRREMGRGGRGRSAPTDHRETDLEGTPSLITES